MNSWMGQRKFLCLGGPYHLEYKLLDRYEETLRVAPRFESIFAGPQTEWGEPQEVQITAAQFYTVEKVAFQYAGQGFVVPMLVFTEVDKRDFSKSFDAVDMELILTYVVLNGGRDFQGLNRNAYTKKSPDIYDLYRENKRLQEGRPYIATDALPPNIVFEEVPTT